MRALVGLTLLSMAGMVSAQTTPDPATAGQAETTDQWEFSASLAYYFVSGDDNYFWPTVMADRGHVHLEARYNYEDIDTSSLWLGYNLSFGEELTLDLTPMVGGVFGATDGIAPGYELTLAWSALELYAEGEYVFDTGDASDSFFYSWSELTISPVDWLYVGIVSQRTKAREEATDLQIGPLVGFSLGQFDLAAYLFDPGSEDWSLAVALGVDF